MAIEVDKRWDKACQAYDYTRLKLVIGNEDWQTRLIDLDTGKTIPILKGDIVKPYQENNLTVVSVRIALVSVEDLTASNQDGD